MAIKNLRDLFANKEALASKRKALKEKALAKRESIDEGELDEVIETIKQLDEQIAAIEERIKETRAEEAEEENNEATDSEEAEDADEEEEEEKTNKKEERIMRKIVRFNDKMSKEEVRETEEYRSAFFKRLQGKDLDETEAKALQRASITSVSGSAGAAIPTKTMDEIIGKFTEVPGLLSDVRIMHIPELISIPKEDIVNDASWIAETAESTDVADGLTAIALAAYKLIRTVSISAHVQSMTIPAFEAWLVDTLVKKMRAALSNAIVNGTGTNQPTGIESLTFTTGTDQVVTSELSADDLLDAESYIDEGLIGNAKFYMNRKMFATVRKLKDSNKRPLFERLVEDGARGQLIGYPVVLDKYVPDNVIYFADASSAYVLNFTRDIEVTNSKEVGFRSGDVVYRGLALVDGKPTGVSGALVRIEVSST